MNNYSKIEYIDNNYKNTNNRYTHPKNAGEYKISINLAPEKQWEDNTTGKKIVTCKINKKTPNLELNSTGNSDTKENIGTKEITLTSEISGTLSIKSSNNNYVTYEMDNNNIKANNEKVIKINTLATRNSPTTITITVTPNNEYNKNYKKGTTTYTVNNIKNILVAPPTNDLCNNLFYNGKEQALATTNEAYQLINNSGIEIGTHTITAHLKYGYIWNNNTTNNIQFNCDINPPTPTVTFKDATCNPSNIKVIYNNAYGENQKLCTPSKIGYTFTDWYIDNNYVNKITNETVVKNTENHDLYAKWTANKYTITFDATGGKIDKKSKTVTYDSNYGELPTPTREGYNFIGWFTNPIEGTEIKENTTVTITDIQTLYAHWKSKSYLATVTTSSYDATASCTEGRTLANGNCIYKTTCEEPCIKTRCDSGCGKCYVCPYDKNEVCGCEDDGGKWVDYETTCEKDCTLTQNEYRIYTCPKGGTLTETTCKVTTYTCPNGGTLNNNTCIFE